jgi:hypothetical protein
MPLINLVVILILIGVGLYCVNAYVPMQASIKKILNVMVVIVVILWLLSIFFGPLNLGTIRVGRN